MHDILEKSQATFMSILELLLKGGWVMVPILLLSVLTLYALIERMVVLYRSARISQKWLTNLYNQLLTGGIEEAKLLCEQKNTAIANVIKAGLENLPHEPGNLEKSMEVAGQAEIHKLEKNLSLLASIAGIAPMLGFLGTVLGMIQAFMAMAQTTNPVTPQLLAGGIYEAMITTAAGLIVGIIADISYKYIVNKVEKASYKIEQTASQLIEIVQESYKLEHINQANEA
ncbi:MAG: biopolymer transporter ExbB [Candidatus Amoebophilus sp. 36-38]|nr:MAG: biopolymer transporter ExbB [Candidatus Amoebophilus sp. 36-38]